MPATVDLIPDEPPQRVRILVPRPQLGDLVPALNNETTLYDEPLRVELGPIHVVAARLGDRPETILATYAHLLPSSDERAAVGMATLLANAVQTNV